MQKIDFPQQQTPFQILKQSIIKADNYYQNIPLQIHKYKKQYILQKIEINQRLFIHSIICMATTSLAFKLTASPAKTTATLIGSFFILGSFIAPEIVRPIIPQ